MPGGFGRNAHFGWAEESAWGTGVAPTKYAEPVSEAINVLRDRQPRAVVRQLDLNEGSTYDRKFGAEGSFTIEGTYSGLLRLFEHLFGDASGSTVVTEASVRWTHTFVPKDTLMLGKGLSFHVNTDVDAGATPQRRYNGWKMNTMTMRFDALANLMLEFGGAAKDHADIAATTPTFPAYSRLVAGHQGIVKIDTVQRKADSVELTFDNGADLDKRVVGSKFIDEPVRGDRLPVRALTGTIRMDANAADLAKLTAGTLFQLDLDFTGPVLGAGTFKLTATMTKCEVVGDPYHVNTPGIMKSDLAFRAQKPTAGDLITLVVVNDEAAIA